jgi:hypothetical protein
MSTAAVRTHAAEIVVNKMAKLSKRSGYVMAQ